MAGIARRLEEEKHKTAAKIKYPYDDAKQAQYVAEKMALYDAGKPTQEAAPRFSSGKVLGGK